MLWKARPQKNHVKDKPPSSELLTFQTGNDPAGKATPLYAARVPHHQSRPDEEAPAPCRPEDTRHGAHVFDFWSMFLRLNLKGHF